MTFLPLFSVGLLLICLAWLIWKQNKLIQIIHNERILNYFATSLYGRNSEEDIFWDIAKNCISQLGLEDCVIYRYDSATKMLVQKAAYGPKNPDRHEILNPILIPIGQGITGTCAQTRRPIIVGDTRKDPRYIVDDEVRLSELAVPILSDQELIGVIDSEHRIAHFFRQDHLVMLMRIAQICAAKIHAFNAELRIRDKIARDLHDEMGSALTSIQIMSKVAQKQPESEQVQHYLRKINQHSHSMMENMSDIVWSINPENDTLEKLLQRIQDLLNEQLEPLEINYTMQVEGHSELVRLNPDQRKNIYLIIKEALNNLVKHSRASQAQIRVRSTAQEIRIQIQDNGCCQKVPPPSSPNGNGIQNMRARAEHLGGSLEYQILPAGTGLQIEFSIPITPSGYT